MLGYNAKEIIVDIGFIFNLTFIAHDVSRSQADWNDWNGPKKWWFSPVRREKTETDPIMMISPVCLTT